MWFSSVSYHAGMLLILKSINSPHCFLSPYYSSIQRHKPFSGLSDSSFHIGFLLKSRTRDQVELKVLLVGVDSLLRQTFKPSWKSVSLLGQKLGADVAAVTCCWFTSTKIPAYLASTDSLSKT